MNTYRMTVLCTGNKIYFNFLCYEKLNILLSASFLVWHTMKYCPHTRSRHNWGTVSCLFPCLGVEFSVGSILLGKYHSASLLTVLRTLFYAPQIPTNKLSTKSTLNFRQFTFLPIFCLYIVTAFNPVASGSICKSFINYLPFFCFYKVHLYQLILFVNSSQLFVIV